MEKLLQIAYESVNEAEVEAVKKELKKQGFSLVDANKEVNPDHVVLVFLTPKSRLDSLMKEIPWLQGQYEESSFKYLRAMPFIPYHPSKEDIDDLFDAGLGELYEEVFSGEFKPYGWDLDDPDTIKEFLRVLEEGYEE